MSVSGLNKEVATRLFKMLAVNEHTVNNVKRDHASYAKLSLLTQQVNLLQHQAQLVVDKSEAKMLIKETEPASENRITLSSDYDEGAKRLCTMLAVTENTAATISKDPAASAKMSLLAEQVGLLQQQAKQAVDEARLNQWLSEIIMSCRVVPGTVYYLYTQDGKDVLSRIADNEWSNYEEYHGKYLYDFDFTFRKLDGEVADGDWHMQTACIHPHAMLQNGTAPLLPTVAPPACDLEEDIEEPEPTGSSIPAQVMKPVCAQYSRW